jgi:hypothetical protein
MAHTALPAALVVLLAAAAPAGAQTRPLLTEEATTGPAGRIVFETGFNAIADEPNYLTGVERTRWDGPLIRFVYSPAENVELDLEWVARVGTTRAAGEPAVSAWGDVTLRAKVRALKGEGRHPTLGARFGVTLPDTPFNDKQFRLLGLGPNTLRAFVEGLLTQPIGPAQLHVSAGLFLQDEVFRPHEQRDFLSYGLAVTWPVTPGWDVVAEFAGRAGKPAPGAPRQSEVRAGVRLGRGCLRGDAAVRRGLVAAQGTWGGTVGLAWTIRPSKAGP